MKSEAIKLLDNIEIYYENIYNLLAAFQESTNTANQNITVTLKNLDGTTRQVNVNSFQKILQELTRIDANYKSLISSDNLSYTLEADGSISQQTKTSFINAEYLENFVVSPDNLIIERNSNIDDLVFPCVKLPITLNNILRSDIFCRIFKITEGYDIIPENPTILDLEYLYSNGDIVYSEIDKTLKLQKNQIRYFGKFTTESVTSVGSNNFNVTLNSIKYTGLNIIGNSIDLKNDDILVSKTGSSKYQISNIDKFLRTMTLTRIAGSEIVLVGIENLYFNEISESDTNIVNVPIKPEQKLVIFLSTENIKNISFPSKGIKIDTSEYMIIYQNEEMTLDEFFGKYVTNFSEYLTALLEETTIPPSLGVIPSKPSLMSSNFKVIQINKHLNNAKTITELTELEKQKQLVTSEINYKNTLISDLQAEIDSAKFKTIEEKNYRLSKISTYRNEINILNQNLLNISRDIDNNAVQYGLKTIKPKYKIIGFWQLNEPILSPLTKAQYTIKYEIMYRYLSKNSDVVDSTSYKMQSGDKEVSVSFSNWNEYPSKTLQKIMTADGSYNWETPILESTEDININQCAITINENESVEIKVRAVSEAGFPIAPLKSEWSEILRIDFPNELKENNISSLISQNTLDLSKSEFNGILQNLGLLSHIQNSFKEGEKTFLHPASDIASGQYTAEQKNISLDTVISTILKEINSLKATNVENNVLVNFIDFNNENFSITNGSTIESLAGNYTDNLSILDTTKWGSIIRKKAYIKIRNNNLVPIEIKTLVPGTIFDTSNAPNYFNVPVKIENLLQQSAKQIIYFRDTDITGQPADVFKIVKDKLLPITTKPATTDINPSVPDVDKNIVYYDTDDSLVKICKLNTGYNRNFNAFTIGHPLYSYDNMQEMVDEFNRIKLYTDNIKAQLYQSKIDVGDTLGLGFSDNDFYAIGLNTCGAFLYPLIPNLESIRVVGNTTTATLILPKESEILIPIMYEYRMIDRLGNIDGQESYDVSIALEYAKKIGIDMFINNENFKFDLLVKSRLKSKIATLDNLNLNSVVTAFGNEGQENLD
jgi:hypothetical protein